MKLSYPMFIYVMLLSLDVLYHLKLLKIIIKENNRICLAIINNNKS